MKEPASKKLKPQAISFVVNGSLLSDFFFSEWLFYNQKVTTKAPSTDTF